MNGKGDSPRNLGPKYRENYDSIFRKTHKTNESLVHKKRTSNAQGSRQDSCGAGHDNSGRKNHGFAPIGQWDYEDVGEPGS